jgi:hypothetical protein
MGSTLVALALLCQLNTSSGGASFSYALQEKQVECQKKLAQCILSKTSYAFETALLKCIGER